MENNMMISARIEPRKDRLVLESDHDPYKNRHKPPEPSVCRVCNAVFRDGRWQRTESWPMDSKQVVCHACQRTRDDYPAGIITLKGSFARAHREEILALARHHEQEENTSHVLHRIMGVEEGANAIVIKTTDIHLPRRIGEAVRRAYKGELQFQYEEDGCFLRANWTREA
jgi:hypothetical protein